MDSTIATRGRERESTALRVHARSFSPPPPPLKEEWRDKATTRPVTDIMQVYDSIGGVVSVNELLALFCGVSTQPISRIARWIVERRLVRIEWRSQTLLPLFQFDLQGYSLRPGIEQIIAELSGVFDDLDIAIWLTQPNYWLNSDVPAQVFSYKLPAVLDAARADRFVAM